MTRTTGLGKTTSKMSLEDLLMLQVYIAGQFSQATSSGPLFCRFKQPPADAMTTKLGSDVPALQVSHGDRRSPLHMIMANGHLREPA